MKSFAIQVCLVAASLGACSSLAEGPDELSSTSPGDAAHATPLDGTPSGETRILPYIDPALFDAASTPSLDDSGWSNSESASVDSGRNDSDAAWADSGAPALDASSVDAALPPGDPNWNRHCTAFAGDDAGAHIPQGADCIAERLFEADDIVTAHVSGALEVQSSTCPSDTDSYGLFEHGGGQSRYDKCCRNKLSGQANVKVHLTMVVRLAHFSEITVPPGRYWHSPVDKSGYWATRTSAWDWAGDLDWKVDLTEENGSRWTFGGAKPQGSYVNWLIQAAGEQVPTAAWSNNVYLDGYPRMRVDPSGMFNGDPWRRLSAKDAAYIEFNSAGFVHPSNTYNCEVAWFQGGLSPSFKPSSNAELRLDIR